MTAPSASSPVVDNALLSPPASDGLPAFDRIRPEHAAPAIDAVLAENRARLRTLLERESDRTRSAGWEGLIEPLEAMADRVARAWGPVSHLFGVTSTPEWRKAYNECLPKITAYHLELSQNDALFRGYEALAASSAYAAFSPARRKVIHDALRDFK
ncbi:MAG: oligopeptidase A, partial [Myxococcota bacterium]|nr:oligopeptidase A [Myxococcota bacterium]